MDQLCREKLEAANKLIFVRRYDEAERVLAESLLIPNCSQEPLVHLRRIELSSLLGRLPELREQYLAENRRDSSHFSRLCLALVQLFMNPGEREIVAELQALLQEHGASAPLYFAMGYAAEQAGNMERARTFYDQSIAMEPDWYPSLFGLSQVFYSLGDDKKGDQYFHQFELMAPFNVYGNFETHRRLSQEFFKDGRFDDAERAIQALTNWWVDNKGFAPGEIQVYENLATSKLSAARGITGEAEERRERARAMARELIAGGTADENVLYFVARVLSEFGEQEIAFHAYKQVLKIAGGNASVVQKVGSHFLGAGEFAAAEELFEHAYQQHPDNPEIRFCLLVARLKTAGVGVEEYLIARERLRTLVDQGDRAELLGILNALMQKFPNDWDVHFHLAELFAKMGHTQKAGQHFTRMYELDPLGQASRLRYANFLMQQGQAENAMAILDLIQMSGGQLSDSEAEVQWLKCSYYDRKQDWEMCGEMLRPLLDRDPWNITYLIQEIANLTGMKYGTEAVRSAAEQWVGRLSAGEETKVNWQEFATESRRIAEDHAYALAYARRKLQFLYMRGNESALRGVVSSACTHDAAKGARDLMRLLNTNFDVPAVYWGLGLLYKELWQLEVASMWFEHTLQMPGLDNRVRGLVYVDLADSYTWRNANLPKAVEYCRLALDVGERGSVEEHKVMLVMAHALLRQGQARQAAAFIEQLQTQSDDYELLYLAGLVQYRNGHPRQANEIWKPLLKFRTEQMRDHKIKQEILRYYFEGAPYAPRDLSKAN